MAIRTHGESRTRLYRLWKDMRRRCGNSNRTDYELYGGRGIKVCDEWNEYEVFRDWALQNGYKDQLSIERINFDGNYEPSNCEWIELKDQAKNTRQNVFIEIDGIKKTLTDWSKLYGLNFSTVWTRYRDGLRGKDLFAEKKVTMTGKHHTEETKARIREKMSGANNHNYGKKFSQERRDKISAAHKGRVSPKRIQFEQHQIDEMITMYKVKGKLLPIATKFGCDRKVIKRILIEKGVM